MKALFILSIMVVLGMVGGLQFSQAKQMDQAWDLGLVNNDPNDQGERSLWSNDPNDPNDQGERSFWSNDPNDPNDQGERNFWSDDPNDPNNPGQK